MGDLVIKAKERLFLNKDKTKVVKERHPEGATLLAAVGVLVPVEYHGMINKDGTARGKTYPNAPRNEPAISAQKLKDIREETSRQKEAGKEFVGMPSNREAITDAKLQEMEGDKKESEKQLNEFDNKEDNAGGNKEADGGEKKTGLSVNKSKPE